MLTELIKPKLEQQLEYNIAEIRERILNALTIPGHAFTGTVLREHIMIKMKDNVRHYWSPVLNIDLFEEESGTRIKGNIGPHPNVWGMFVAIYCMLGMFCILGTMFGISQMMIEQFPSGFLVIPLCLLVAGLMAALGFRGQKKASSQVQEIKEFLDQSIANEQSAEFPLFL